MTEIDRNTLENSFIDLQGDVLALSLIVEDLQKHCSAGWAVVGREPIPGWTVLLLNEEQALAFDHLRCRSVRGVNEMRRMILGS